MTHVRALHVILSTCWACFLACFAYLAASPYYNCSQLCYPSQRLLQSPLFNTINASLTNRGDAVTTDQSRWQSAKVICYSLQIFRFTVGQASSTVHPFSSHIFSLNCLLDFAKFAPILRLRDMSLIWSALRFRRPSSFRLLPYCMPRGPILQLRFPSPLLQGTRVRRRRHSVLEGPFICAKSISLAGLKLALLGLFPFSGKANDHSDHTGNGFLCNGCTGKNKWLLVHVTRIAVRGVSH